MKVRMSPQHRFSFICFKWPFQCRQLSMFGLTFLWRGKGREENIYWRGPWVRPSMWIRHFFPSFHEQNHIFKLIVSCWAVWLLTQVKWYSPVWWTALFNLICPMPIWLLGGHQGGLHVTRRESEQKCTQDCRSS